jgi:hypothetical protein
MDDVGIDKVSFVVRDVEGGKQVFLRKFIHSQPGRLADDFPEQVCVSPVVIPFRPQYLAFAGLTASPIPCYPVTQHIAEKLHALVRPRPVETSRIKDLVDLLTFAGLDKQIHADRMYAAIRAVFEAHQDFINPILDGTGKGIWDPEQWKWKSDLTH